MQRRKHVNGNLQNGHADNNEEQDGEQNAEEPVIGASHRKRICGCLSLSLQLLAVLVIVGVVLYLLLRSDAPVCYPDSRDETCYHGSEGAYRLYGTKTDYRVLARMYNLDAQREYVVPGCTSQGLFLFNRHTIRYPDRDDIVKMVDAMPRLQRAVLDAAKDNKVHLCKEDIEALSNWTLRFRPEDDNHVTASGEEISSDQAKRFRTRFPDIFRTFKANDYVVGFTSRVRTRETADAFLRALLTRPEYFEVARNFLSPQDDLLQFHKECSKLIKDKEDNPAAVEEYEKGPYMQRLLDRLTWRLGFNVTKSDLKMMLRSCVFEYAIYDQSPWCSVFTEEDLKALEFRDDLDDYYEDGYGRERNYAQACPIIQELVDRLEIMAKDPTQPNKVLFFSHAGGFKKVVARLGLNRDTDPPRADGLCSQANRAWRSSLLCPFNANLAFVLYKCSDQRHEVVTFLNEQPQLLPGCPGHRCPLATFVDLYKGYARSCNITEICSV